MGKLTFNNWYVKDNILSISLENFNVFIDVKGDEDNILLTAEDNDNNLIKLTFNTLGETIFFTENFINTFKCNDDILYEYNKMYSNKREKKLIKSKDVR